MNSEFIVDLWIEKIAEAFKDVPEPTYPYAVDSDWDKDSINQDFSLFLKGEAQDKILSEHAKSPPGMTPDAFVFFLKDYMSYALRNLDSELTEHLIYRLSSVKKNDQYWRERLDLFSNDLSNFVVEYCSLLCKLLPENDYFQECLNEAKNNWNRNGKKW